MRYEDTTWGVACLWCGATHASEGDIKTCRRCGTEYCEGCIEDGTCPRCEERSLGIV